MRFDEGPLPLYARVLERLLPPVLRMARTAPGCFLFCTRGAYLAAGGFDEAMDWAEEVAFARRLKRLGRFVILRECVITSARKLRAHTATELLRVGVRLALAGRDPARRRKAVEYWYGAPATRQIRNPKHAPLSRRSRTIRNKHYCSLKN